MDQAIKLKLDGTNSERLYEKRRAEYNATYREVKRQIRRDKRNWTDWIAKEAEEAANKQQMMTLYNLTKTLCNEKPRQSTAVNNREETADPVDEEDGEPKDEADITDKRPVMEAEIRRAIKDLKNGKALGEDLVTTELRLKTDLELTTDRVRELIDMLWRLEKVPPEWKRGLIVRVPKKGNLEECKN